MQAVFGESIDREESQVFGDVASRSDLMLRFDPAAARLSSGFVYELDGRVVGNVTLLSTKTFGRYVVANVAVDKAYRRRGIATKLMNAATERVRALNGNAILLQVVEDNTAALGVYQALGYVTVGNVNTWVNSASRLRSLSADAEQPDIRPLPARLWREAFALDVAQMPSDLNWPEPLLPDAYRGGLVRRFTNFLSGREIEPWATYDDAGRLTGLATIWSEPARAHMVTLRVRSDWTGRLERPLLSKVIRRLGYIPRRMVRIDHPKDDLYMNQLLLDANFQLQRTLTHMRLDLVAKRG